MSMLRFWGRIGAVSGVGPIVLAYSTFYRHVQAGIANRADNAEANELLFVVPPLGGWTSGRLKAELRTKARLSLQSAAKCRQSLLTSCSRHPQPLHGPPGIRCQTRRQRLAGQPF